MKKISIGLIVILTMIFSSITCFAAADPHVTIVNPNSNTTTLSANSLLISIKVTQPKTISITVYEEKLNESQVKATDNFTSLNNLSYYTRQLNNLSPGVYRIRVETKNNQGAAIYSSDKYVTLKNKADNTAEVNVFDTPQTGTSTFLQNLLKSIFGS